MFCFIGEEVNKQGDGVGKTKTNKKKSKLTFTLFCNFMAQLLYYLKHEFSSIYMCTEEKQKWMTAEGVGLLEYDIWATHATVPGREKGLGDVGPRSPYL